MSSYNTRSTEDLKRLRDNFKESVAYLEREYDESILRLNTLRTNLLEDYDALLDIEGILLERAE